MTLPPPPVFESRRDWAERIAAAWRQSLQGIIETGRLLIEAKATLDHGDWLPLIERDLPFGPRYAQMLMKVAADSRITNTNHGSLLPPSPRTLYELTKLSNDQFAAKIASGAIHPELERREVVQAGKRERRIEREAELGAKQLALPDKRYGVLYSDCAWDFEVWSRETGMDRAAANHYPTAKVAELVALYETLIVKIAAEDCVHFMWTTRPFLMAAGYVMEKWGFAYKTTFGWEKTEADGSPHQGTGYWAIDNLELLLVGTRGAIPCPSPGTQWRALIKAPVIRGPDGRVVHSAKPAIFYELIEAYFPSLPKIELFARSRRSGWDAWGLEAPAAEAAE
jgi:N6-adenosine-specific RNA methylase IME4